MYYSFLIIVILFKVVFILKFGDISIFELGLLNRKGNFRFCFLKYKIIGLK